MLRLLVVVEAINLPHFSSRYNYTRFVDYYVSIENSPYMRWQIALLYESFRIHGLEDKLLIACAESDYPELNFGRVMYHENVGRKSGYPPLNRPFGMVQALERGLIRQPFVAIEADMVMRRPAPHPSDFPENRNLDLNWVWYMEWDNLHKVGYKLEEWFGAKEEHWKPGGCIYAFNEVPDQTFKELLEMTKELADRFSPDDGLLQAQQYWMRDMVAFLLVLSKPEITYGLHRYESYMSEHFHPGMPEDFCFVHYCNGVTGEFDKRCHNANNWFSLDEPVPFETILKIRKDNLAVKTMKAVVRRYLSRHSLTFPVGIDDLV